MATLHRQSRTTRPQRNSAVDIRRIADRQPLPEYRIDIRSDGRQELAILSRDPLKPKRPRRGFKPQLLLGGRLDCIRGPQDRAGDSAQGANGRGRAQQSLLLGSLLFRPAARQCSFRLVQIDILIRRNIRRQSLSASPIQTRKPPEGG